MIGGYANTSASAEVSCEPELARLSGRVTEANLRLRKLVDHIASVSDRLCGTLPSAPAQSGLTAGMPSGTVPQMWAVIKQTHNLITEAEDVFSRLGGL